ncbi:uncharacterized protein DNG_01642 [Cephalotrichum gorgonifer]|uniref:Sur7 protein n=1 Tax=Cephalotrichum gorgonifer TaxID=2041049 RepID=A0AAE8MTM2_9PEZI|nr:uncharacterized protein DNG_01642 [Cephalotrichum gorgonifer]
MQLPNFSFRHIIPLLFLIAGFVLVNLCLFAGSKPGHMEEYALIRIDMSDLGKNLFTSSSDDEDKDKDKRGLIDDAREKLRGGSDDEEADKDKTDEDEEGFLDGIVDGAKEKIGEAKDKVKDKFTDITNDLAEKMSEKLGIVDWYSLHITTFCQGEFVNGTDKDGGDENNKDSFDVKNCTSSKPGNRIDLNALLGESLSAGPIDISLEDLSFPAGIQRQVAKLNSALQAVFVLYALAVGLTGLTILTTLASVFLPSFAALFTIANAVLSTVAAVNLALGSAVVTAATAGAAEALGDLGENIGVSAKVGQDFINLTWIAFGLVGVAAAYWGWEFLKVRKEAKARGKWQMKTEMREV